VLIDLLSFTTFKADRLRWGMNGDGIGQPEPHHSRE